MPVLRLRHFTAFAILASAIATFHFGPDLLALDGDLRLTWMATAPISGTFLACITCLIAAQHGVAADRAAWKTFGTASALYLSGNLFYLFCGLAGYEPGFPTAPEFLFFIMGFCFARGMLQYGNLSQKITRLHLYNFILVYCAIAIACLFLLHQDIKTSVLTSYGTLVAVLYPALWFSVAAFGLMSLILYRQGARGLPFGLLLGAVFCEAAADFRYAQELLDGTFQLGGGITQLLWITSTSLIIWAALEHRTLACRGETTSPVSERKDDHTLAQAVLPGAAIAIFMLAGSFSGAFGRESFLVAFSAGVGILFASVAALREQWIIHTLQVLRRASEQGRVEVAEGRRRLITVLESMSDGVIFVDGDWHVVFFNDQAADLVGRAGKLELGADFWAVFPIGKSTAFADRLRSIAASKGSFESEEFQEAGKTWLSIGAHAAPDGVALFFRDVSERRRARDEISHMALHDGLTGLANRGSYQRSLDVALISERDVAMLLIDLDHFKEVNDTLGHLVGDAVLVATAERLRACVPEAKTIARLGGDEFAVVLTGDSSRTRIEADCDIIASLRLPLSIDGHLLRIGCSIGIAIASDGTDKRQMFTNADIALYEVKAAARGRYRFFEPSMEHRLIARKALRDDLVAAIENDEFELFYQPLVDLATDRISSFEALLRWRHPTRGMIAPDVFIPVAEETGLILPIGEWALRAACTEAMTWPEHLSVAVNLSTRQFTNPALAERVGAILAETGFPAARLELEITESAFLDDSGANMRILARLREMGIRIALDDFGTGYSSLSYLQKFPFSKLKIDRSFVADIITGDEDQVIISAVLGLGKALGIRVTAEGVETAEQYAWLKRGCNEAQGYLISRPVPATEIPALLLRNVTGTDALAEPVQARRRA